MSLLQNRPIPRLEVLDVSPDVVALIVDHANAVFERCGEVISASGPDSTDGRGAVIVELV